MEKMTDRLKDGCEFTQIAALAALNISLLGVGLKLVLTQSDPQLCSSYCILLSAVLFAFLSIYRVQNRQRLMLLGVSHERVANSWDANLHMLGWLRTFNVVIGILVMIAALLLKFHPGKLHPIPL